MSTYTITPGWQQYTDQQGFVHPYDTRELAYHGRHALEGLACSCQGRAIPGAVVQLGALAEGEPAAPRSLLTDLLLLGGAGALAIGAVWLVARK